MTTPHRRQVPPTAYFATVPEWLLWGGFSAGAIQLWATLHRLSDQRRDQPAFPSWKYLTALLGASRTSLHRYTEELKNAGVLIVEARYDDNGVQTSNWFHVVTTDPASRTVPDITQIELIDPEPNPEPDPEPVENPAKAGVPDLVRGGTRSGTGGYQIWYGGVPPAVPPLKETLYTELLNNNNSEPPPPQTPEPPPARPLAEAWLRTFNARSKFPTIGANDRSIKIATSFVNRCIDAETVAESLAKSRSPATGGGVLTLLEAWSPTSDRPSGDVRKTPAFKTRRAAMTCTHDDRNQPMACGLCGISLHRAMTAPVPVDFVDLTEKSR